MSNVKIVLFKSKKFKDGTSPVLLRLIVNREIKYFSLDKSFKCYPEQWDESGQQFYDKAVDAIKGNNGIKVKLFRKAKDANGILHTSLGRAETIVNNKKEISIKEFEVLFNKQEKSLYLYKYIDELIKRFKDSGRIGNAIVYSTCKGSLQKFFGETDFEISRLTVKDLNLYTEDCYDKQKLKSSSVSNYLRTLRAICNRAIKEEGIDYYPFEKFNWKQLRKNKTEKRALSKFDMLRIIGYQVDEKTSLFNSLKYFTFSYLTWGLNFSDLSKLTMKNLKEENGTTFLSYNRSKGGRLYEIPLSEQALVIIRYYRQKYPASKYIFPVLDEEIHDSPAKIKTRIQTVLKIMNSDLKVIAGKLEIKGKISSYVARHSFATILKNQGLEISMIGEMLGHSDPRTTQIYLKDFDYLDKVEAGKKLTDE